MKAFTALLIALACPLALPVTAVAAPTTFVVDTTADEADAGGLNGICLTAGGKCSLRAAIEESNASTADDDTITFASNPFDGKAGDTIVAANLPLVTDKVHIDGASGGQCTTSFASQLGPCAEVSGSGLVVEADGVEIDGLAITGAIAPGAAAVRAFNGAQGLVLINSWIGVKLDGSAGPNGKGVYLDPDSNGATIGGAGVADRNVIANNEFEGLDIDGADNADVLGNYFGVKPDGTTSAPNAGKNIEITDTVAFEATGNEVGTTVVTSGAAPCDGGCNVIAGSTFGIDLQGNGEGQNELPATGPTTIRGNFIGLNAAGTETRANTTGVNVGEATNALIGGLENADANFIAGGSEGIFASSAEGFEAVGNIIGSGAAGAEITAPGKGVWVLNITTVNPVAVAGNVFDMDGGIGIEARFGGTEIISNFIEGAELGVHTTVGPGGAGGNLIEDNVIGESLANGIFIEDDQNEVLGNAVFQSGDSGILLETPVALLFPSENLIGGDASTDENNINESGGDAIEIVDESGNTEEDSLNEVGRNKGAKNAGLFIDLVGAANAGIQPPQIDDAKLDGASGSGAGAGANVRVFRKETTEAGEVKSFLGEAIADSSGDWSVNYISPLPGETQIAATQTSLEGATSELAFAQTEPEPQTGGGGNGGGGGGSEKPVPQTTIKKGPKGKVHSTTAKFRFISSLSGSTFECKLDRKKFKPCKSPKTYKKLKPGKHVFRVRAKKGGVTDPTPAVRKFKVLG